MDSNKFINLVNRNKKNSKNLQKTPKKSCKKSGCG